MPWFALLVCTLFASMTAMADSPIGNFREVAPGLFAGTNPIDGPAGPSGFADLVQRHIMVDIDLQGLDVIEAPNAWTRLYNQYNEPGEAPETLAQEKGLAVDSGIAFVNLPINSNNPVSLAEAKRVSAAVELIAQAAPNAPVYLHCEHGADRTGLVVALFRVLKQGWSIDDANSEWTKYGHNATARLFTGGLDAYFCSQVQHLGHSEMCDAQVESRRDASAKRTGHPN